MLERLKELRKSKGISQQQLADVILVSQQSVNKYENHNVEPDIETLIKIAEFFEVSVDYLIGRTNVKEQANNIKINELSNEEIKILKNYRELNNKQKACIDTLINSYK